MGLQEVLFIVAGLVWIFGWGGTVWGMAYRRGKARERRLEMLHQERMTALEKGVPLPELTDLPEIDSGRPRRERRPGTFLLIGIICSTVGFGTMLGWRLSANQQLRDIWSMPMPMAFFGLGLLLYHYLTTRKPSN